MSRFHSNRIALIHANDGTDVRVGKVCRSLSKMGFDTHFIGWDRRPHQEKPVNLGNTQAHLLVKETPFGRSTIGGEFAFARHIAATLAHLRPETVCCVNEEHVLLTLPWKRLFYRFLVGDIHDELANRKSNCGKLLCHALSVAGGIARAGTDRIVAVDGTRYNGFGRHRAKCTIIENYPEDPGPELALRYPTGPIKIYVCGALQSRRGIRQVTEVVDRLENVEIVSAGSLFDDFAREHFATHPKVKFHGIVTSMESLGLAAGCDAIFAFYEPTSINNLQASPNKIFDAISVGRPVIINEEAYVSQWVVDNDYGMRCPYSDIEALCELVSSLENRRGHLPEYASRARKVFVEKYTWGSLEPNLRRLFTW